VLAGPSSVVPNRGYALRVAFLDAASSTPVGTHEQQRNHNEKQKNERAYEGAAGEAKNDQGDNEQQKQIHERPFV
jgi:hypothetical protein